MTKISLAEDTVSREDIEALSQWLLTYPRLTKGELTEEFEALFARRMGCAHAIYVSSGSAANLIAANALLTRKSRRTPTVIVPAVSWVTTVTPFLQLGYNVLMCDCDPHTLGVDLTHFESLCKRHKPDAAIIVHVLGHDSSIHAVQEICAQHGTRLIEDTCEAIGSEVGGRKLGAFGDFGTFSFYFGHQLSSIEGGVIVTDDFELAQVAKSMRAHGWARDSTLRSAVASRPKTELTLSRAFMRSTTLASTAARPILTPSWPFARSTGLTAWSIRASAILRSIDLVSANSGLSPAPPIRCRASPTR